MAFAMPVTSWIKSWAGVRLAAMSSMRHSDPLRVSSCAANPLICLPALRPAPRR